MTATRPMGFDVRPLADGGGDGCWRWSVHSLPDRGVLRDGQVVGDRDKAERAARAAIAIMGGTLANRPAGKPRPG